MEISELYNIFREHPVVTTDSRDCPQGSIFVALKGESFDGNRFAAAALEKGCYRAVVDEAEYATDERCILVDDSLKTLQQLARHHRRQFSIPVIGITGTNGKTTTKELTAAVLGEKYRVLCTAGNFNNDIGVPKTLLRLTADHDIAVVEMGASHPGDIRTLVNIVEPDCGLITNVGRAHLQGFGSFEGVVRTKGELYDFLRGKAGSVTFVNADNATLEGIAAGLPHILHYGQGAAGGTLAVVQYVGQSGGDALQCGVVGVYEGHASGLAAQEVVKLALSAHHALERAEPLQVGASHVGYQSAVGLYNVHQCAYVSRVACAHLHHGYVVVCREAQQRLGHADVVVEVACRAEHAVFLAQYGCRQFLCRCLAVGAGYAYHGYAELPAVVACKLLQRLQAVVYEYAAFVRGIFGLVHHGPVASLFQGGGGKAVAVERFAFQCHEY